MCWCDVRVCNGGLTDCCCGWRSETYGSRELVPDRCRPDVPLGSFLAVRAERHFLPLWVLNTTGISYYTMYTSCVYVILQTHSHVGDSASCGYVLVVVSTIFFSYLCERVRSITFTIVPCVSNYNHCVTYKAGTNRHTYMYTQRGPLTLNFYHTRRTCMICLYNECTIIYMYIHVCIQLRICIYKTRKKRRKRTKSSLHIYMYMYI